jgi:hypothetical protein
MPYEPYAPPSRNERKCRTILLHTGLDPLDDARAFLFDLAQAHRTACAARQMAHGRESKDNLHKLYSYMLIAFRMLMKIVSQSLGSMTCKRLDGVADDGHLTCGDGEVGTDPGLKLPI